MLQANKRQKRKKRGKVLFRGKHQTQQKRAQQKQRVGREEVINTSQEGIRQFWVRKERDDSKERHEATIDKSLNRIKYLNSYTVGSCTYELGWEKQAFEQGL